MKSGLLWYDADPQMGVQEKVARAAQRYRQKLGRCPTVCYVNPAALGNAEPEVDCLLDGSIVRIRLSAAAQVLPHHFWMGEEDAPAADDTTQPADRAGKVLEQAGSRPDPAMVRPQRRAARCRREEGERLQEAMAARAGVRRQQADGKAQR
jgi:hypothetical protein